MHTRNAEGNLCPQGAYCPDGMIGFKFQTIRHQPKGHMLPQRIFAWEVNGLDSVREPPTLSTVMTNKPFLLSGLQEVMMAV